MVDQGPFRSRLEQSSLYRERILKAIDEAEVTVRGFREQITTYIAGGGSLKLNELTNTLEVAMKHKEALLSQLRDAQI